MFISTAAVLIQFIVATLSDAPSQFGAGCAALAFRFVRPEVTSKMQLNHELWGRSLKGSSSLRSLGT